MKKNLFFLLALAAFALVGCEDPNKPEQPDDTQDEITSIRFEYDSVQISMDDVRGVKLVLFPTVEAAFTTSDSTIITVDATGRIFPVAEGKAVITATYKELVAECTVTVLGSQWDLVKWSSLEIFNQSTTPLVDGLVDVPLVNGSSIKCELYMGIYYLLGEGLYVGTDYYLHGSGYIATLEIPTYFIKDDSFNNGKYNGAPIGVSSYLILPDSYGNGWSPDSLYCAQGGAIVDINGYGTFIDEVYFQGKYDNDTTGLTAVYKKYLESIHGTFIYHWDVENDAATVDLGMITAGEIAYDDFDGDEQYDIQYIMNVEWFDGFIGLDVDDNGDIIKPYSLLTISKEYVEVDLLQGAGVSTHNKRILNKRMEVKPMLKVKALPTTKRVIR